ncbi:TIGR00270 family protein [Candidatus Woesearchaeota archaeon]|nr:TIGR00270 family protein [Candidatus Woesearchaeota archaeon]
MRCDLCGAEENLYKTIIEGAELNVCRNCSKHGKVLREVRKSEPVKEKKISEKKEEEENIMQMVSSDFSEKIRKKREIMGMEQEEFAKSISEKESVVHKLETGELKPSIKLAEKLEKKLGIKLIEEYKEEHKFKEKKETGKMTIGDMIKLKKK